jgi:predicted nucleic acid-binding protein
MGTLALDTTILSHFASADRLDTLKQLLADHECVTTEEVIKELMGGVMNHPPLANALSLPWITIVTLGTLEVVRFASYKAELGGNDTQNMGESSILAWASNHNAAVIIDDRAATYIAQQEGIKCCGTLTVIFTAVQRHQLSRAEASDLVEDLRATGMRLPADPIRWAFEEGLLPED